MAASTIGRLNALIMGPPGGGKGTIAKKIIKDFGFFHLSTGDVLRANVRQGTAIGQEAKGYMTKGKPDPARWTPGVRRRHAWGPGAALAWSYAAQGAKRVA